VSRMVQRCCCRGLLPEADLRKHQNRPFIVVLTMVRRCLCRSRLLGDARWCWASPTAAHVSAGRCWVGCWAVAQHHVGLETRCSVLTCASGVLFGHGSSSDTATIDVVPACALPARSDRWVGAATPELQTPNCWSYDTKTLCCADRSLGCATRLLTGCGWPRRSGWCHIAGGPRSSRSLLPRS
jgi:hypothetical protein